MHGRANLYDGHNGLRAHRFAGSTPPLAVARDISGDIYK